MSTHETPDLILEWSPEEVRAYWPGAGETRTGSSIGDAVSGRSSTKALVLISRRASFLRTARLPNVGGRDLQMLLKNVLPGLIPLPSGELAYDIIQTGDMTAEGRLVIIGAVLNPYLTSVFAQAKSAGVTIAAVIPAGLTATIIAQKVGLRDAAVVEEVAGGLTIDIVANGILRYSRLAVPSSDLESEVARTYSAAAITPASSIAAGGSKLEASYSTSVGSLKAAAEIDVRRPPMNIELQSVVEKRVTDQLSTQRRLAALVLAASLAISGFAIWSRIQQNTDVLTQRAKSKAEIAKLQTKYDAADKLVSKVSPIATLVDRGFNPPQRLIDVLKTITSDVPDGVWLAGVNLERGKPFTIRGSSLKADAVTQFLVKLGAEQRLRDVKLLFANDSTVENRQVIQFSIQGFPVGNLPLVDDKKAGSSTTKAGA